MALSSLQLEPHLRLDEKIGEGEHREVFRCDPYAIKVLKIYRVKRKWLRTVRHPLQNYVHKRYGIDDFNRHEQENYQKLSAHVPATLRDYFNPVHWAGSYRGRSISICGLVLNDDGHPAQTLTKSGIILDEKFWQAIDEIENFLLEQKLYFIGINGDNILVKKMRNTHIPVFVDYKWFGREAYPCQFWLRCENGLIRKLRGKFTRIRELYKPI